jgi:hypothetical protein
LENSEVAADGEMITYAKYHVTAENEGHTVETEGNWWFKELKLNKPFAEVTEDDVAKWIEADTTVLGVNTIKSCLEEQLAVKTRVVVAPWLPQIFTPSI